MKQRARKHACLILLILTLLGQSHAQNVPLTYQAVTDRNPRPKPALPVWGAAGSIITDPTFGSRILRVTDANTEPDHPNRSYSSSSSSEQNVFNRNGKIFYALGEGAESIFYSFDPLTMNYHRMGSPSDPYGGLTLLIGEGTFSYNDPNLIYGINQQGTRAIVQYNFSTNRLITLRNLNTLVPGLSGYVYDASVSANEKIDTCFGGGGTQDTYALDLVWDKNTGKYKILNTQALTITDGNTTVPVVKHPSNLAGFTIHNTRISKDGRYVVLTKGSGNYAVTIWDTQTNELSELSLYGTGHKVGGYGFIINHSGAGDGAQWQRRALDFANLTNPSALINPLLTPAEWVIDSHLSWNNAQSGVLVPVLASTYRPSSPSTSAPLRPWDDEIIAIRTDGLESKVWRFAHHRSVGTGWTDIPRGNVSPDGRFFLFQSNWGRTLGSGRHDTFIVALTGYVF